MIWMAFWWTVELFLIAGMLWLLFSAFRRAAGTQETPEKILRRRLAAGEIDADEYERQLAALSKTMGAA
jgi:uncharacterized membrane protein